jgi:aminopeptidase N
MENASAIFYTEGAFTGLQNMERIIAHETAHQWFGNSTTEADWPHIWLSEGFATYLTHLYIEHTHGRAVMENDMAKDKQKILAFINSHPESAIVEHDIENINFLINANSYEKAGWVLHMLRHETGDAHFWNILKTYLGKYRHNNAETKDFVTIVNRITGNKYDWFFDQWLYRPGIPTVSYTWTYEKNKITIQFEQQGTPFLLPIDIQLEYASGEKRKLKTGIAENKETIVIKSKEKPTAILLDPDHWLLARLQPANP